MSKHTVSVIVILLLAAGLRLWDLGGESLWLDEAATLERVEKSFDRLARELRADTQFPLFYWIEKIWCGIAGTSEAALRFPSVVFGVAAVGGIFALANALWGASAGLIAALLLAVNPFAIFYAQEARPYSLLLAAAIGSAFLLLQMLRRGRWRDAVLFAVCGTVLLHSHQFGIFIYLALAAGFFILRGDPEFIAARTGRLRILASGIVPLLLTVPLWIYVFNVARNKLAGTSSASWIPLPTLLSLFDAFRQYFMHPAAGAFAGMLVLAGVLAAWRASAGCRRRLIFVCVIAAFCLLLPWLASFAVTPLFVPRYTIGALAAMIPLQAYAIMAIRRPRLRAAAVLLAAAVTAGPLADYYTAADKDPWRFTAAIVRDRIAPGDAVVLDAPYLRRAFTYYFDDSAAADILAPWSVVEIPADFEKYPRVWLVQAYSYRKELSAALLQAVADGRSEQMTIPVRDCIRRNPFAYHVAEIRIALFSRYPDYGDLQLAARLARRAEMSYIYGGGAPAQTRNRAIGSS